MVETRRSSRQRAKPVRYGEESAESAAKKSAKGVAKKTTKPKAKKPTKAAAEKEATGAAKDPARTGDEASVKPATDDPTKPAKAPSDPATKDPKLSRIITLKYGRGTGTDTVKSISRRVPTIPSPMTSEGGAFETWQPASANLVATCHTDEAVWKAGSKDKLSGFVNEGCAPDWKAVKCYRNAVLVMLLTNGPLMNYVEHVHRPRFGDSPLKLNVLGKTNDDDSEEYRDILLELNRLYRVTSTNASNADIENAKATFWTYITDIHGQTEGHWVWNEETYPGQQDAAEFLLRFLLVDAVQQLRELEASGYAPVAGGSATEFESLFKIVKTTRMRCSVCGNEEGKNIKRRRTNLEKSNYLSLPLQAEKATEDGEVESHDTDTLDECIAADSKTTLPNWKCAKCEGKSTKGQGQADKYDWQWTKFPNLPEVLFIHLLRFKVSGGEVTKNGRLIRIPESIDLRPYMENDFPADAPTTYRLQACVGHRGNVDYGHYVTFANISDKLYKFNDEKVKTSTLDELNAMKTRKDGTFSHLDKRDGEKGLVFTPYILSFVRDTGGSSPKSPRTRSEKSAKDKSPTSSSGTKRGAEDEPAETRKSKSPKTNDSTGKSPRGEDATSPKGRKRSADAEPAGQHPPKKTGMATRTDTGLHGLHALADGKPYVEVTVTVDDKTECRLSGSLSFNSNKQSHLMRVEGKLVDARGKKFEFKGEDILRAKDPEKAASEATARTAEDKSETDGANVTLKGLLADISDYVNQITSFLWEYAKQEADLWK